MGLIGIKENSVQYAEKLNEHEFVKYAYNRLGVLKSKEEIMALMDTYDRYFGQEFSQRVYNFERLEEIRQLKLQRESFAKDIDRLRNEIDEIMKGLAKGADGPFAKELLSEKVNELMDPREKSAAYIDALELKIQQYEIYAIELEDVIFRQSKETGKK